MTKQVGSLFASALVLLAAVTMVAVRQPVFSTLLVFKPGDGLRGASSFFIQGRNGEFYSASPGGVLPRHPDGALYVMTTTGRIVKSLFLNGFDGDGPGSLLPAVGGNFYDATGAGGKYGKGAIIEISSEGEISILYNFCSQTDCSYGSGPEATLIQGREGYLYGTTTAGGNSTNGGTVFRVSTDGSFTTLYEFCSLPNCTDGREPTSALVEAPDGSLYGTTTTSSPYSDYGGTVFRITPDGMLTTLYLFCTNYPSCPDGTYPNGLVLAKDGNFYGTTLGGGTENAGTAFKITPAGVLTTLYNFCTAPGKPCPDGDGPNAIIQADDGNFYGTAANGGKGEADCDSSGCGIVFKLTPTGSLTTLHEFSFTDGWFPISRLFQATNGILYGTTTLGGDTGCVPNFGCGTIFSVNMGLPPFVAFVRAFGKVGQTGPILGQGFTGTTSVTLNGIEADFTVVSDTYIRATVPQGATTGYVTVTTPTGVLKSNVPFHVIQ